MRRAHRRQHLEQPRGLAARRARAAEGRLAAVERDLRRLALHHQRAQLERLGQAAVAIAVEDEPHPLAVAADEHAAGQRVAGLGRERHGIAGPDPQRVEIDRVGHRERDPDPLARHRLLIDDDQAVQREPAPDPPGQGRAGPLCGERGPRRRPLQAPPSGEAIERVEHGGVHRRYRSCGEPRVAPS